MPKTYAFGLLVHEKILYKTFPCLILNCTWPLFEATDLYMYYLLSGGGLCDPRNSFLILIINVITILIINAFPLLFHN